MTYLAPNALLIRFAKICLIGFVVSLLFASIDNRQWLGQNIWLKPSKFYLSVIFYVIAIQLITAPLRAFWREKVRWAVFISMAAELILITMQSARGVGSHFNGATLFDQGVYAVMGFFAFAQIPLGLFLLFLFFRERELQALDSRILWGIRCGLFIFVLGCVQGGYLGGQSTHAVGGAPGAPRPASPI